VNNDQKRRKNITSFRLPDNLKIIFLFFRDVTVLHINFRLIRIANPNEPGM